ncbi:hypothetical protein BMR07_01270 [Methylococcaceae bacterium CS1]|nr:hypothetical protein BMR10_00510 [Methylococcaceae bacterium CS4]TXL00844.1 hypothetical protein BMR11_02170 [Methylococcaceae bacterium CS5]TXL08791.1 hypothetical protein BMR07_01270 [Methylococcaceae bacterium CS1]TXL09052.1 hypothetical protein BMR09_02235 [Methylococcaceae bacterium CS3]TXL10061.1 hypothetical protein BMR08_10760 [Methylococcaceae bacterium CS2]
MYNHSLLRIIFFKKNNRFLVLLFSLILFFAIYPIVENSLVATLVLNLFFMLIIFSGVIAISDTRRPLLISVGLALLAVVFRWTHYFYQFDLWLILEHSSNTLFWTYIAVRMLKFILSQSNITAELIYAAVAVYFIFGLAWASIYQVIEISNPSSFSMSNAEASTQNFIFQMWYFSMVTLTTLGYGDISPVTMTARVFVVLEAIMRQFYLAVLIASLIGRRIAQGK